MSTNGLSPPGSSTYNSNTMTVGDGTWDSSRNTFLLPNLMGLNFATTRYNGMGNRFKGLPEYHQLILGHGVLAAITFIGIMPLAIFLAKYGKDWPGARASFKLHVYLQILTVFLTTVILVLGWFAVGPERSLSNPHHGIGVAIYVLILFQFIYGTCWYRRERKRTTFPTKLPFAVWIHRMLGRSTAILAFVQIPLGLTLYGSPRSLFILYALAGVLLVFLYLALDYYYKPRIGAAGPGGGQPQFYSDYGSYVSGTEVGPPPRRREEHHWGRDLLAAGGAVGVYEWWKRRSDRRRDDREDRTEERIDNRPQPPQPMGPYPTGPGAPPVGASSPGRPVGPPSGMGSRPPSGLPPQSRRPPVESRYSRESWEDEKYGSPRRQTWGTRVLEGAGAFAAYEGVKSLFSRRRRREDEYSEDGRYGPPDPSMPSRTDVSRVEAGQTPMSPDTPRVNMGGAPPMTPGQTPSRPPRPGPRPSGDSISYDSRESYDGPPPQPVGESEPGLRDSIATMGAVAGFREWNRRRKERRGTQNMEDRRRQEIDDQWNRRNSESYPRPQDASGRRPSMSGTLMTGPSAQDPGNPESNGEFNRANTRPDTMQPPLPAAAGTIPSSSATAIHSRQDFTTEQGYSLPPPPPGPPPNAVRPDGYRPPAFGSAQMPAGAVNPDPSRLVSDTTMSNTAANESSAYGRDQHYPSEAAAGAATLAATTAAATSAARAKQRNTSESPTQRTGSRSRLQKRDRRGSTTSASASQLNSPPAGAATGSENPDEPPVSVKVKMHNDGRHVTLRRLNEEEAAAERAARRQERRNRNRSRRGSSLSSGVEDEPPPGQRYRRMGGMRPSNNQPITNVPPPPPMSSSAGASQRRDSELNLPSAPPVPQHSISPQSGQGLSPPVNESGVGSPGAYGTDAGTGTDVSAFADNRRRRRAERARRLEAAAARGGAPNRVAFDE